MPRINWGNFLRVFILTFAWWWVMELLGLWKMDVEECADAVYLDLADTIQPGEELDALAVELCTNLRDAGVVL